MWPKSGYHTRCLASSRGLYIQRRRYERPSTEQPMSSYFYLLMFLVGVIASAVVDFLLRLPMKPSQKVNQDEEAIGKMIKVIERINTGKNVILIMLFMTLLQTAGYLMWRVEFSINSMYRGGDWAAFFIPSWIVLTSIMLVTVPSIMEHFTQKINQHKELFPGEKDALRGMLQAKLENIFRTAFVLLMLNMSIPTFILGRTNLN